MRIVIGHSDIGLFFTLFAGMYVAFLIAYICVYIHADSINFRFSLGVGALLAVIGNKYIIDSSLPESVTFTLVDTLRGITLVFIFFIISCMVYLLMNKQGKLQKANCFDMITAQVLLIIFVSLNLI